MGSVPVSSKKQTSSINNEVSLVFLNIHGSQSDFASQLATFINDTPAGYTVSQEVRNGQTCHCRAPAVQFSSSSSSAPVTTAAPAPAPVTVTAPAPATAFPTLGSSSLAG